jgi:FkbM family methyltransferase
MFSDLFKSIIYRIVNLFLKHHVCKVKYGLCKGFKRQGWFPLLRISPNQTPEEQFLLNLKLRANTIYDVGAYVGITTMFFALRAGNAGQVFAFEPNPENYTLLRKNLILNHVRNVKTMKIGIGCKQETKTIFARIYDSARSTMDEKIARMRISRGEQFKSFQVEVFPLDVLVEKKSLPKPDFVKIDVEGMENEVLSGMTKIIHDYKPKLHIEIHGIDRRASVENAQKIMRFLKVHKYTVYHVESNQKILQPTLSTIRSGHLFCA